MAKSLTYCLRWLFLIAAITSCQQKTWYRRDVPSEEKSELAKKLNEGASRYYQGSAPNMALLEEGLEMDSTLPELWREMATPYLKRGMPHQAFRYYAREVALAPADWQGWRGYLYLYFYRDYRRAIADFNATDTLTPITDYPQGQSVDYMRGLSYYGLQEYDSALLFFDRYIAQVSADRGEDWVDTYAFLYRGLTYEKLGEADLALRDFSTGLKYDNRLSDFYFHSARVMTDHKIGSARETESMLQQALTNFRDGYFHHRDYVEVHDQLFIEDIEEALVKLKNTP